MRAILCSVLLANRLLATEPSYTQEDTDPAFAAIQRSGGGKPSERFNRDSALGSRIKMPRRIKNPGSF